MKGNGFNEDQIEVFDDVLCLLIARVEPGQSRTWQGLAPIDYAPFETIQHLARITKSRWPRQRCCPTRAACGPAISWRSPAPEGRIICSPFSGRKNLPEAVTDVIVDRGERKVIRKACKQRQCALFGRRLFHIVARADADDELTEIPRTSYRSPIEFLRDLLRRATNAVRARLAAIAPPELQEEIRRILKTIAGAAGEDTPPARDFSRAEA